MKPLYVAAGHVCVLLGAVGAFTPILPTTPFLLLGAWCYSKGSRRMHAWLTTHRWLGPPIRDWHGGGVIRTRAKLVATALIVPSFAYVVLARGYPAWGDGLLLGSGALVLGFIWTRPSRPPSS